MYNEGARPFGRAFIFCACGAPPTHPLGAPARLAFGIGALRLALWRKAGGFTASGALLSSGRSAKEGENKRICLSPAGRGRILADAPALTLARVLAHCCKRFRSFGARAREGFWVAYERKRTEGICML